MLIRSRIFVEKYSEALDYCKESQVKFADSVRIKELVTKVNDEMKKELRRIDEISTISQIGKDKKYLIYKDMRSKKIKVGKKVHHLPEIVDVNISLDSKGLLHFPVLILYDEFMATDFIQDWLETSTLKEQLYEVFRERPPWDEQGTYTMKTIEVYFEADVSTPLDPKDKAKSKSTKKYVKCSLESTLLEVLQHEHHIVP